MAFTRPNHCFLNKYIIFYQVVKLINYKNSDTAEGLQVYEISEIDKDRTGIIVTMNEANAQAILPMLDAGGYMYIVAL
jgi:hypothetical protein